MRQGVAGLRLESGYVSIFFPDGLTGSLSLPSPPPELVSVSHQSQAARPPVGRHSSFAHHKGFLRQSWANLRKEIFLPSYANFDFDDLERKQDPVQEIVVTDEEREKMFPS